ncbi:MAG: hypothetical protein KJP21_09370 [Bacteroidia bacterium]|nr:hypothetical protein [Bacteroidia bacterium]NNJ54535.1 hypothetical protein [Bacteroidia bacterium]
MEETISTGPTRPQFLTILCILTFIGSGWGIVDAITDYFGAEMAGDAVEMVEEEMDEAMDEIEENEDMSDSQKEFLENIFGDITEAITPENIRKSSLVNIISCLLTLFGAILMWQLKRVGYFAYIAGILVMVIGMAVVFEGVVGLAVAGMTGFIGVVFIVLYGVNLKHMK